MDIVFATKNAGKIKEIRAIMEEPEFHVMTMTDVGVDDDVVEDGVTFEENALKKAVAIMKATGKIVLADDSGLEIDFLDGQPGVQSARFLGRDTPYTIKNEKIIDMLKDASGNERSARFVCVIAAALPTGQTLTARGLLEGVISHEAKGSGGFGYDPIFLVPEFGITLGEMPPERKNALSHRRKALDAIKASLIHALSSGTA